MAKKVRFSTDDTKEVNDRIRLARKYAEDTWGTRDEKWAKYYKGKHPVEFTGASVTDYVVHNYVGRIVDLKSAGLAAQPPSLRFRPSKPEFEELSKVWEVYMPYVWREGQVHRQMKAALKDRFIYGRGWVSVDWRFETDEVLLDGDRRETEERVLYDNPLVKRIAPQKVFLDPTVDALNWEDAQFVVVQQEWPIDQFRKWAKSDKRVNKRVADKVKGERVPESKYRNETMYEFNARKDEYGNAGKKACVYRYHERERGLVVYIAQEADDEPLLVMDNPYRYEGYHLEPMWQRPQPDELDCIGDVENLEHWQRLFNLIRSKQATMIRNSKRFVAVPNDITEEDIQALESNADKTIVRGGSTGTMPREVNTAGFPPEFIQFEGSNMRDFTEISGITALRRGTIEMGLDTATETASLVSQSSIGDRDDQAEWEDYNRRVARKAKALVEQFGDSRRVAAVSPEVAQGVQPIPGVLDVSRTEGYVWVGFTPQQIADESEVEVLAGSMGAKEEAVERQQMINAVKVSVEVAMAGQFLQAIGVNPQEVAKEIYRSFGTNTTERFFQAPKPLPPGVQPGGGAPTQEPTDMQSMLKSVLQSAVPGSGAAMGGQP